MKGARKIKWKGLDKKRKLNMDEMYLRYLYAYKIYR